MINPEVLTTVITADRTYADYGVKDALNESGLWGGLSGRRSISQHLDGKAQQELWQIKS